MLSHVQTAHLGPSFNHLWCLQQQDPPHCGPETLGSVTLLPDPQVTRQQVRTRQSRCAYNIHICQCG